MRESEQYNRYLTKEETTRLAVKYHMMHTHLGEQVGADYRGYRGYSLITYNRAAVKEVLRLKFTSCLTLTFINQLTSV